MNFKFIINNTFKIETNFFYANEGFTIILKDILISSFLKIYVTFVVQHIFLLLQEFFKGNALLLKMHEVLIFKKASWNYTFMQNMHLYNKTFE